MKYLIIALIAFVASAANGQTTSGAVTQENIHQTICVRGYTATVRPTQAVSGAIKRKMMRAQHLRGRFILDHKLPLELGGAPIDPQNLQLQTVRAAAAKDRLENDTRRRVCSGELQLDQGQALFGPHP